MPGRDFVAALAVTLGLALAAIGPQAKAHAGALSDITSRGTVRIAVPQDFAPFGSAGPDLKPQGLDVDMANLIGKKLGVKVEIVAVTSANRIPYLQTKKVDLVISSLGKNAERAKVIDFSDAYAPFFSGVFGVQIAEGDRRSADLAGKTVGATRGAIEEQELTKMAPKSATVKRFEDNNATISAFVSGQVDLIATGNVVAAAISAKTAVAAGGAQVPDPQQPLLRRHEQGRAGADGQGQRHHRRGEEGRRPEQASREVAEERAAARLLIGVARIRRTRIAEAPRDMTYAPELQLAAALLAGAGARGLVFTSSLTLASTVVGVASASAGAWARHARAGLARRRSSGLCRTDPQHAVHRPAVLHLLRPAGAGPETDRDDGGVPRHGRSISAPIRLEIIRAGIEAVPKGHIEAGASLAMSRSKCFATSCCVRRCSESGRRCRRRSSSSCWARRWSRRFRRRT